MKKKTNLEFFAMDNLSLALCHFLLIRYNMASSILRAFAVTGTNYFFANHDQGYRKLFSRRYKSISLSFISLNEEWLDLIPFMFVT